jgi:hypothetical protein
MEWAEHCTSLTQIDRQLRYLDEPRLPSQPADKSTLETEYRAGKNERKYRASHSNVASAVLNIADRNLTYHSKQKTGLIIPSEIDFVHFVPMSRKSERIRQKIENHVKSSRTVQWITDQSSPFSR